MINGTEGTQFAPFVKETDWLQVFPESLERYGIVFIFLITVSTAFQSFSCHLLTFSLTGSLFYPYRSTYLVYNNSVSTYDINLLRFVVDTRKCGNQNLAPFRQTRNHFMHIHVLCRCMLFSLLMFLPGLYLWMVSGTFPLLHHTDAFMNVTENPYNCAFSDFGPSGVLNATSLYGGMRICTSAKHSFINTYML